MPRLLLESRIISIIAILAAVVLSPAISKAGVVIKQRTTFSSADSPEVVRNQTITLQGDKEKYQISDNQAVVFDASKQTATMLDHASKSARELPLRKAIGRPTLDPNHLLYLDFKPTDKTHELLGFKCREYTGTVYRGAFTAWVTSCFSTDAAGSKDFSRFMKSMVTDLGYLPHPISVPPGVPLAVQATVKVNPSFAPPGLSPSEASRFKNQLESMPARVTKVEVTRITSEKLSPDVFDIPAGYTLGSPLPD
jgi:hypothetical protein